MRTTQLPASTRQPHLPHRFKLSQALLGLSLAACMLFVSAGPAQAWWLDVVSLNPSSELLPASAGLSVEPLTASIPGSFILQPLLIPTAVPASPALTQPKPTAEAQVASATTTVPQQILNAVNQQRRLNSTVQQPLPDLVLNDQLGRSAQAYAEEMQRDQLFSHTGANGDTLKERNEAAGYTRWSWMGENIAYGQTSVAEVMAAWMKSEGHRKNILDPRARELGVGYAPGSTVYWAQEFGAQF